MKKQKRILPFMLAFTMAVFCFGGPASAEDVRADGRRLVTQLWSSGAFHTRISDGKCMVIGPEAPLSSEESMNFIAVCYPSDADIDLGIMDANNVFHYINSGNSGADVVNGGVAVPDNGWYTIVVRNNSEYSAYVFGVVESCRPDKTDKKPSIFPFGGF